MLAASRGQAGTGGPVWLVVRALGSNFSTQTGTEEATQEQTHLPLPVGDCQTPARSLQLELRLNTFTASLLQ